MKAMLCNSTETPDKFIEDDNWYLNEKYDGMRLLATTHEGRVSFWNRVGLPFRQQTYPNVIADLLLLPGGFVFDGEIMKDGTYRIFDILSTPNKDWSIRPYTERIYLLDRLIETWRPKFCALVPVVKTTFGKQAMIDRVAERGGEGVIFKRADSTYEEGTRSDAWLKYKMWRTADCLVAEVSPTGKSSVSLALVHDGDWAGEILGKMKDGRSVVDVGRCKVKDRMLSVLQPGHVIEVKYLYLGENNHLYSPSMLRMRTDKVPVECTTDQLVGVNRFLYLDAGEPLTPPPPALTVPSSR